MSEWDPWKHFEREKERYYWDPYYRYEYERDRTSWDPWYRIEREQDRMSWDPFYRAEKEIERRYSDPEYRWRLYEERRYSSDWYEVYLENPRDPVLRDRYESMYRDNSMNDTKKVLNMFDAISELNRIYDRGSRFWLGLVVRFGAIGFLFYLLWVLISWRPPMP